MHTVRLWRGLDALPTRPPAPADIKQATFCCAPPARQPAAVRSKLLRIRVRKHRHESAFWSGGGCRGESPAKGRLPLAKAGLFFRSIIDLLTPGALHFNQLPGGGTARPLRKIRAVKGSRVEIFSCPQTIEKILTRPLTAGKALRGQNSCIFVYLSAAAESYRPRSGHLLMLRVLRCQPPRASGTGIGGADGAPAESAGRSGRRLG